MVFDDDEPSNTLRDFASPGFTKPDFFTFFFPKRTGARVGRAESFCQKTGIRSG